MDNLTPLEERLVRCVEQGGVLDLTNGRDDASEEEMRSWNADRRIRADVIRDILRGKLAGDPDPRGIRLRGARVDGHLDLRHVTTAVPLELWICHLPSGADLSNADVKSVDFCRCRIAGLDLQSTYVSGQLRASGATISDDTGPALHAEGLRIGDDLFLDDGFTATGSGELGAVRLANARVAGGLVASGAVISNDSGPALAAAGVQIGGSMFLQQLAATGAGETGAIRLLGAQISGQLTARNATISNHSGPALYADGFQVKGGVFLTGRFTAIGTGESGAVRLLRARVDGALDTSGATISNDRGPALHGDGLHVNGDLFLRDRFIATGAGELGTVRLAGAVVDGVLDGPGAIISNARGPALVADGLRVGNGLVLRDRFTATGAGELGTVRFLGARVDGNMDFSGATINNDAGPALHADRLQVNGSLRLRDRFTATGHGGLGTIRLLGARVDGNVVASGATISNDTGPALRADSLQVTGGLFLNNGFTTTSSSDHLAILLTAARVGGLNLDLTGIKDTAGNDGILAVNGLIYPGLPESPPIADWLAALAHRTDGYNAQPYQQLAAAARAAGHDGDTRRVLMAQRRDQIRRRAILSFPERTWAKATGILLGYGYQPWRSLIYLLAVLTAAISMALVAGGHHGGLTHTSRTPSPGSACSIVEQIGVGIDLGLPLIKTTARETCTATATTAGQTITVTGWALQVLAWALATLFIAGFTGAVRKPERVPRRGYGYRPSGEVRIGQCPQCCRPPPSQDLAGSPPGSALIACACSIDAAARAALEYAQSK